MLLVIDVGNTNITLGVFDKEELFGTFRMKTKQPRTSDEYGITLQELVERHGIESSKINAVIIASVVPDVMHSLGSAIIKYFGVKRWSYLLELRPESALSQRIRDRSVRIAL